MNSLSAVLFYDASFSMYQHDSVRPRDVYVCFVSKIHIRQTGFQCTPGDGTARTESGFGEVGVKFTASVVTWSRRKDLPSQSPGTATPSQRSLHRYQDVSSASHLRHHHVSSLTGHAQSKHRITRKLTAFTVRAETPLSNGARNPALLSSAKSHHQLTYTPERALAASGGPLETARATLH